MLSSGRHRIDLSCNRPTLTAINNNTYKLSSILYEVRDERCAVAFFIYTIRLTYGTQWSYSYRKRATDAVAVTTPQCICTYFLPGINIINISALACRES